MRRNGRCLPWPVFADFEPSLGVSPAGTLGEPSVSVPVSTSDFSAKNHYMGEPPPRASQQFRALPAPLRSYRPPRGGPSGIGGHVRMGGGGMDAAAITALLSPRTDAG